MSISRSVRIQSTKPWPQLIRGVITTSNFTSGVLKNPSSRSLPSEKKAMPAQRSFSARMASYSWPAGIRTIPYCVSPRPHTRVLLLCHQMHACMSTENVYTSANLGCSVKSTAVQITSNILPLGLLCEISQRQADILNLVTTLVYA